MRKQGRVSTAGQAVPVRFPGRKRGGMATGGTTHYETLRVPETATRAEIQSSFRRLVKIYHPDKNPRRTAWAESKMRELLEAYRILSDDRLRFVYDRRIGAGRGGMTFVERMRRRKYDLGAQSQLVLHYLLEGELDEAVALHEELVLGSVRFSLGEHLDERDYLDSLFLLGEAYEGRRQWRTALRFYREAYEHERNGRRKRYFFDELKDRLRVLYSQRLVQGLAPEDALKNYGRALELCIENREAALIYKKIATLQSRLGQRDEAMEALEKAKSLCPNMKTIDVLRKKIAGN